MADSGREYGRWVMERCTASGYEGQRIPSLRRKNVPSSRACCGGLILRAALSCRRLGPSLRPHLHAFISLATPHLGLSHGANTLVNIGLWALKLLRPSKLLDELRLQDSNGEGGQPYLETLSSDPSLSWFRHVGLVSARGDSFVPPHSANIEIPPQAESVPSEASVRLIDMAGNIVSSLDPSRLVRLELEVEGSTASTTDELTGRSAHICFLDRPEVGQALMLILYRLFTPATTSTAS